MHSFSKIRFSGFILTEILLTTIFASMMVLGVIALFLPLKNQILQQSAWANLQHSGRMATMVLLNQLDGADIKLGSVSRIRFEKKGVHKLIYISKTHRKYLSGAPVYAIYMREGLKHSNEWVAGVSKMRVAYDVFDQKTKKYCRVSHFVFSGQDEKYFRVVGVDITLQLTAETGLTEPWRIYIATKKTQQ